jgi:hypothetical protein
MHGCLLTSGGARSAAVRRTHPAASVIPAFSVVKLCVVALPAKGSSSTGVSTRDSPYWICWFVLVAATFSEDPPPLSGTTWIASKSMSERL